jgi:DNA-binding Lrp family transcriptional regulator
VAGRIRRTELDEVDHALLAALRRDGRASNVELAKQVGISEKTVRTRIARLVDEQGLKLVVELTDPRRRSQMVYLLATEAGQRFPVAQSLAERDEVTQVHLATGSADVLVAARFPNDAEAQRFQRETLREHPGVREIRACHLIQQVGGADQLGAQFDPVIDTGRLAELMIPPRRQGSFDEVADRLCQAVTSGLRADRALIATEQAADGAAPATPAWQHGLSRNYLDQLVERIRVGRLDGPVKRVWETRQHLLLADARTDPLLAEAHDLVLEEGYVTLLTLPLLYGPSLIAAVSLYYNLPMSLSDDYIATAQGVVDQFAVGMARALGLAPPALAPRPLDSAHHQG